MEKFVKIVVTDVVTSDLVSARNLTFMSFGQRIEVSKYLFVKGGVEWK